MARRRPSFRTYVRRRWRALGLLGVLLLGSLLLLVVTDRGHDPAWEARSGPVEQIALSPDGSLVYSLLREEGRVTSLQARRAATGQVVWESALDATRALLVAQETGVAVATDFPRAFLTSHRADGSFRYQVALEGSPRAIAADDDQVAVALQAPGQPVLLFDEKGQLARTHRFSSFVNALDHRGGNLAVGTGDGKVTVHDRDGESLLNASLPVRIVSLRLSSEGTRLLVGAASLVPGELSGLAAAFDLHAQTPLLWSQAFTYSVGLVDVDARATRALVVEESPPRYTLHGYDMATGEATWTRVLGGYVGRDESGGAGGAAISPGGDFAVAGTLDGNLEAFALPEGRPVWSYAMDGSTSVRFARDAPHVAAANARFVPNGPYDAVLLLDVDEEPLAGRIDFMAGLLAAGFALLGCALLAVGYWRVRRNA